MYSQLRRAWKSLAVLLVVACQGGAPSVPPPYARDVARLCDAVAQSGAGSNEFDGDRKVLIATWLGKNLETQEMRNFLVSLQQMTPAQKHDALVAEGARGGVAHCALADEWR